MNATIHLSDFGRCRWALDYPRVSRDLLPDLGDEMIFENVVEKLYRGSQPMTDADWQKLKDAGITSVISLETDNAGDGDLFNEAKQCKRFGMDFFPLPLGRFAPPTGAELYRAASMASEKQFTGCFVHCKHGKSRTGMVIAYFRMHFMNWAKDKTVAEMWEKGFERQYFWWIWTL